jgi:hypothetical protein
MIVDAFERLSWKDIAALIKDGTRRLACAGADV